MTDAERNRELERERQNGEALGPAGETREEKKQKDKGMLAALGSGAGCLIVALPVLGFGVLVWLAWGFIRGCGYAPTPPP